MITLTDTFMTDNTVMTTVQDKPAVPRTHRMFQLVLAGFTNAAAVAKIKEEYGNVPTNTSSISWCRTAIAYARDGKTHNSQAQYGHRMIGKYEN